jgi:hypothetical protein
MFTVNYFKLKRAFVNCSSIIMEERNLLVAEAARMLQAEQGVKDKLAAHQIAQQGLVRKEIKGDKYGKVAGGHTRNGTHQIG